VKGFLGLKLVPLNRMQVEGGKVSYYYKGEGRRIRNLSVKCFEKLKAGYYLLKGTMTGRYFYVSRAVRCGRNVLDVNEFTLEGEVKGIYVFDDCVKLLVENEGRRIWVRAGFPLGLLGGEEVRVTGEAVKASELFVSARRLEVFDGRYSL